MTQGKPRRILVTGGGGFIGSHVVDALLARGDRVTSLDNFNPFYDPAIKRLNIEEQTHNPDFTLVEGDIRDGSKLALAFENGPFDVVVHLAAMAGVRPSLADPELYMDVNVLGTQRLIDFINLKQTKLPRFVLGSSSSVYGERPHGAFSEEDRVDRPVSPYAASKAAAELVCHAAHKINGLDVAVLRFFTVYGPRQRPDLAIHKFCQLIEADQPVEMFGNGKTARDYTYVHDIVSGVTATIDKRLPSGFEIINLGRGEPVTLDDMVKALEKALDKHAIIEKTPPQKGDVPYTHANIDKAKKLLNYDPQTTLDEGVRFFVEWQRSVKAKLGSSTFTHA